VRPTIDEPLVRRLVDSQFPQWSDRPLRLVDPAGSDHAIYRLGADLSVRVPRHDGAIQQAAKEAYWLPRLAPHLPLAVPEPVGVGKPAFGYPWPWAVSRWLDGEVATVEAWGDSIDAAGALAAFLLALQAVPPSADLPGKSLAARDARTRADIAATAGAFDAGRMSAVWGAALTAPAWDRPPTWFHGDFHTGNVLTAGGRVSAVIDFGGLGVGDPSCDLTMAFALMSAAPRERFREQLGVGDATWARGRGWALAAGLNAYRAYAAEDLRIAAATTRQIEQALLG
jgi:aminoglycoside phosphotransferase (APT) family kinase protein